MTTVKVFRLVAIHKKALTLKTKLSSAKSIEKLLVSISHQSNLEVIEMTNKFNKKPLAVALGAVVVGSVSITTANAAENPFGMTDLSSGYMTVAEKSMEGKCGEGKCGGDKATKAEGKCAGKKAEKAKAEAKCGEGKCGGDKADKAAKTEAKCGEGKCGGDKAKDASVTGAATDAVKSAKDSVINSTVDSAADAAKGMLQ